MDHPKLPLLAAGGLTLGLLLEWLSFPFAPAADTQPWEAMWGLLWEFAFGAAPVAAALRFPENGALRVAAAASGLYTLYHAATYGVMLLRTGNAYSGKDGYIQFGDTFCSQTLPTGYDDDYLDYPFPSPSTWHGAGVDSVSIFVGSWLTAAMLTLLAAAQLAGSTTPVPRATVLAAPLLLVGAVFYHMVPREQTLVPYGTAETFLVLGALALSAAAHRRNEEALRGPARFAGAYAFGALLVSFLSWTSVNYGNQNGDYGSAFVGLAALCVVVGNYEHQPGGSPAPFFLARLVALGASVVLSVFALSQNGSYAPDVYWHGGFENPWGIDSGRVSGAAALALMAAVAGCASVLGAAADLDAVAIGLALPAALTGASVLANNGLVEVGFAEGGRAGLLAAAGALVVVLAVAPDHRAVVARPKLFLGTAFLAAAALMCSSYRAPSMAWNSPSTLLFARAAVWAVAAPAVASRRSSLATFFLVFAAGTVGCALQWALTLMFDIGDASSDDRSFMWFLSGISAAGSVGLLVAKTVAWTPAAQEVPREQLQELPQA